MEGNKDEALKCRHLAEKYLQQGDTDKAIKFLKKAEKLYPSKKVQDLLNSLLKKESSEETEESEKIDGVRHRKQTSSHGETANGSVTYDKNYTTEQVEAVKRIKNCRDYYEILGIPRDASDADIKKQYRKLALQFHPDKNRAPGATEAFKAIGNAFAVLTDEDKKKRYDRYGDENPQNLYTHNHYDYSRGFEADITPEEIFNMFFGGPMPGGRVYVNRRHRNRNHHHSHVHDEGQEVNTLYSLVQFLPILLLVLMSLLSTFMLQDPIYSLQRTGSYYLERQTNRYKINYYVQEGFDEKYSEAKSLHKLERHIENEYINRVQSQCYRERQYREELYARGRFWHEPSLIEKANNFKMRNCEALEKLSERG
ncbi:dnaJ homolog subfamily B member 14-like isoform X2 [Actinia tenebrosa]|uniref:DnaJ homolog subfamily B member 14-like isoform X2 n=1 Tax=Actinia tenebrosa TaxID=6105 RepID=A0A6P8J505_ACTTE|nr:dnaJ homolog subfamily B member 14-like isoform X2 [Actinia tenebrosa]